MWIRVTAASSEAFVRALHKDGKLHPTSKLGVCFMPRERPAYRDDNVKKIFKEIEGIFQQLESMYQAKGIPLAHELAQLICKSGNTCTFTVAGTSGDFGTPVAAAMLRLAVLTSRISRSRRVGCRREKLRMSFRKCSGAERVAHSRSAAGPREPCGGAVGQARVSQHRGTLSVSIEVLSLASDDILRRCLSVEERTADVDDSSDGEGQQMVECEKRRGWLIALLAEDEEENEEEDEEEEADDADDADSSRQPRRGR